MTTNLGNKIRSIRELKNFTQEYLAKKLGISTRAYSKIESGETQVTVNRLLEISNIFGVSVQEILGFDKAMVFNNNPINSKVNHYVAYNNTEIEEVKKLYERIIAEKEKVIFHLENQIKLMSKNK